MPKKNVLRPYKAEDAKSLGASFTSNPTDIPYLDNVAIQMNVTTSDAVGTFAVEASLDKASWVPLPLSGTPTLAGASDTIAININQLPFEAIRFKYNRTSGSGTVNIYVMAKEV